MYLDRKETDNVAEKLIALKKIIWEHKEQNTEGEADWLEKSVADKVVRFKAGSDLAKHVKSLGTDNVVEEIELAVEEIKRRVDEDYGDFGRSKQA